MYKKKNGKDKKNHHLTETVIQQTIDKTTHTKNNICLATNVCQTLQINCHFFRTDHETKRNGFHTHTHTQRLITKRQKKRNSIQNAY
jgi:hypothetical protein